MHEERNHQSTEQVVDESDDYQPSLFVADGTPRFCDEGTAAERLAPEAFGPPGGDEYNGAGGDAWFGFLQ